MRQLDLRAMGLSGGRCMETLTLYSPQIFSTAQKAMLAAAVVFALATILIGSLQLKGYLTNYIPKDYAPFLITAGACSLVLTIGLVLRHRQNHAFHISVISDQNRILILNPKEEVPDWVKKRKDVFLIQDCLAEHDGQTSLVATIQSVSTTRSGANAREHGYEYRQYATSQGKASFLRSLVLAKGVAFYAIDFTTLQNDLSTSPPLDKAELAHFPLV